MSRAGFLSTAAIVIGLLGGQVIAQDLRDAGPPAEFPPESFSGNQYVDSRGCVFVRAGIGGVTNWVPRVTRERELLCGFTPSIANAAPTPVPQPVNVPNPLDTQIAEAPEPTPEPEAAPAPVTVAQAAPSAPRPAAPAQTFNLPTSTVNAVNPLTGRPAGQATTAQAAPTPRVIRQPVAAAPEPVAEPARRTITRAEACEGRTGIQTNMISSRTGEPIDCGGGAQIAAATPAPIATPAPRPAAREPARMTLTEVCANMDATGRRYINVNTGLPVRCGPQTQPIVSGSTQVASATPRTGIASGDGIIARGLRAPRVPYSNPLDGAPGGLTYGGAMASANTTPGLGTVNTPTARVAGLGTVNTPTARVPGLGTVNTPTAAAPQLAYSQTSGNSCMGYSDGSGMPMRCGPQTESPSGYSTTTQAVTTRAQATRSGQVPAWLTNEPPPYSNPTYARQNVEPNPPAGFEPAWNDGRLNPNRGLPAQGQRVVSYATQQTTQPQTQVSTRNAPQVSRQQPRSEAVTGQRYVQVGTFGSYDDAQTVARQLQARGLPMQVGVYTQGGRELRVVLAGPFGSAPQLQRALSTAQGAGYSGAFARN